MDPSGLIGEDVCLKFLGKGNDRVVFDCGNGRVLKLGMHGSEKLWADTFPKLCAKVMWTGIIRQFLGDLPPCGEVVTFRQLYSANWRKRQPLAYQSGLRHQGGVQLPCFQLAGARMATTAVDCT